MRGRVRTGLGTYSQSSQLIKAEQECQVFISYLDGLTPAVDWFKTKAAALEGDPGYTGNNAMVCKPIGCTNKIQSWDTCSIFSRVIPITGRPVINDLQTKSKSTTASGLMDQRLLAYLSLAFYSLSNRLIISNNNTEARHFVELYKMADPTNSEAWYFSALLSARAGQVRAAENDLLKAAECGFTDMNRLRQQPEFQSLDLSGVGRKMHER